MAQIIKERERVHNVEYELYYEWNDTPGAGFGFNCNEHGHLLPTLQPAGRENFIGCITGEYDVTYHGIRERSWSYTNAAELKCDCGEIVHLSGFTNTCDGCDADYNMSGQLLAPRDQWGEETGEHWSDCL